MSLKRFYPVPTERMGAMLAAVGIKNSAVIEFGPMGTANYFGLAAGLYGFRSECPHFAVHTTDMDLSLGSYEKLSRAILEVEEKYSPELIFIFASAIMNVIGVDVKGILTEAASDVKTPIVVFTGGSFSESYITGMERLMEQLLPFCPEKVPKLPGSYGILGLLPDDFHYLSDAAEIKAMMERYFSASCCCSFPHSCSIEEMKKLSGSDINLVLRSEALPFAEKLREKSGVPYVFFRPYGPRQSEKALKAVADITGWHMDEAKLAEDLSGVREILKRESLFYKYSRGSGFDGRVLLSGNPDTVKGISSFLKDELGLKVFPGVKAEKDESLHLWGEDEWESLAEKYPSALILADGESRLMYGSRAGVVSHPAVNLRDVSCCRPFIGLRGTMELLQLIDDCRPR